MKVTMEFDLPNDTMEYRRVLSAYDSQREINRMRESVLKTIGLLKDCKKQGKSLDESITRVNWFIDCVFFGRDLNEDAYNQALSRSLEK